MNKILIFIDWYEPGFKGGGPIRSIVNFARHMNNSYEIFVFTSDRDLGDSKPYDNILRDQWIIKNQIKVFYASPGSLNWKKILAEIKSINPEFIYLNGMYALHYVIYPLLMKKISRVNAKLIVAPRGMLQQGALQFKKQKKTFFLKAINLLGIPSKIQAHATDEQEAKDISKHLRHISKIAVIPNFSSDRKTQPVYITKQVGSVRLLFVSRISPKKNLLFFLNLLTKMTGNSAVHFTIAGNIEDDIYWNECKNVINRLPENIAVDYKGAVANIEVSALLQQHHVFILPTLGENFGHAIFEAFAEARPVLISDQTPWRNLENYKAGWDISLNEENYFLQTLQEILQMDNEKFQEWSKGAWIFADRYLKDLNLEKRYADLFS